MGVTITLYGIRNCGTVKKARAWLDEHGHAYVFHDFKTQGVTEALLKTWVAKTGWEKLLNRSGMTFRNLPDDLKSDLDEDKALSLMVAHSSAIRRPVLSGDFGLEVGFSPERYATLLNA